MNPDKKEYVTYLMKSKDKSIVKYLVNNLVKPVKYLL